MSLRIIETRHLTETLTVTRRRSWAERLWSWPWRPWRAQAAETQVVPSTKTFYLPAQDAWVCHPEMARRLRFTLSMKEAGL